MIQWGVPVVDLATVTIDVTAVNDAPAITIVPGGQCLADFQGLASLALAASPGQFGNGRGELRLGGDPARLPSTAGLRVSGR